MESIKEYDKEKVIAYLNKEFKKMQTVARTNPKAKMVYSFDAEALYENLDNPELKEYKKHIIKKIK